jgi:hypothetical protein
MIKLIVEGAIYQVDAIEETKNKKGFTQTVILHLPGGEFRGKDYSEEFFVIRVFSTSRTDSRFIQPEKAKLAVEQKARAKAVCYLKGERWQNDKHEYFYNHKLNLNEWAE